MVKVSNSVYSMKLLHGTSFSEVFAEGVNTALLVFSLICNIM